MRTGYIRILIIITTIVMIMLFGMSACGTSDNTDTGNIVYMLESSHEVDGRQGIAWEEGRYSEAETHVYV